MITRKYGQGSFKSFKAGIEREWVITNGIGGYAGSSLIGANTRKHHGLLIASLHAPIERHLVLSRINETVRIEDKEYSLAAVQRKGNVLEEGQKYLQRFVLDTVPSYTYRVQDVFLTKTIAMEHGKNKIAILYEVENGSRHSEICLTPLFNFRDHGGFSLPEQLCFETSYDGQIITLIPEGPDSVAHENYKIKFSVSEGDISERNERYDTDMELQTEIDTGMSSIDNNFTPYDIRISLKPYEKKSVSIICYLQKEDEEEEIQSADSIIGAGKKRMEALIHKAGYKDEFADALVQAADAFIVDRVSTGSKTVLAGMPWFTDWGRDTMIALQGLTLATKRYEDARGILRTFAKYVKDGLVPNMFPDQGMAPFYNTVDASLWYFYSVYMYLKYTGGEEDYLFVKEEIYPKLKEIISYYKKGTLFHIYMDKDSLIHAGGDLDQVTWMDVRVDDWVVTPRHGKPVEINALWYNSLKVMELLAERYLEDAKEYRELANVVKESFCQKFWNEEKQCLYDVVEEERNEEIRNNGQIRPNQIWAVSLPFTMLSPEKERRVVETVWSHLYAGCGLRSLSPEDEEYKGIYFGKLHDRDAAYHQGTAWAFPLGGFISAYVKVNGYSKESKLFARKLLEPAEDHMWDGCIGSIAEIFDGDSPHISRGCYAQAWSVGEILRAYTEDILREEYR
ncbi:putative glycogen debranching enzyme [Kineothrix alysoides]|uniref:Putative glycogen debranching enzyme n=1 Tax=Kineothrix alysoides TaxID=1469948 RepID=A0A4R1QKN9_9FIRM|nr:amylo-alpha-1,6-glucosidase [Kineothrix alysoides]TCL54238.1 putative glycogen debranching enzyme [Kineothrix alysoides]